MTFTHRVGVEDAHTVGAVTLTAIVGATVNDGTGAAPVPGAVVLVDGDRIRSVGPAGATVIPEQATVLDATDQYVVPGLMDANAHLFKALPDVILEYEGRYDELVEEAAQVALKAGVTTVFDTWGPLEPLIAVRDRINRGDVTGSRIFVAGNIVGFGGPFSADFRSPGEFLGPDTVDRINRQWEHGVGPDLMWLTVDEIRRRVREYIERSGLDFVKYGACGHSTPLLLFSEAAQRAIVEEGHRAGLTVQAHTITVESLRMEIEAGADLLQHGNITGKEPLPDGLATAIVERQLPVAALVPTEKYLSWIQENGPEWAKTIGFGKTTDDNNRRLIKDGARLLLTVDGTVIGPRIMRHPAMAGLKDAVNYSQHLGEGHFHWLEAVIERGMAPMEALLSATRHVAEAYHVADQLGTLEPGKRADLLILDGDPLADVRNYRRIAEVVKDGVIVDRDALPLRPVLTDQS